MKKIYTIIFLGISGAGKGTQSSLIREYIEENDVHNEVFNLETGRRFREFMSKEGFTQKRSKEVNLEGKLQPEFLAVWNWADQLITGVTDFTHLIVDGTPRKRKEAKMFHDALEFYQRENVYIINLNLSEEVAKTRLEERGRSDDAKDGDIEKRFEWFKKETVPAIEYLKSIEGYKYLEVNADGTIDDIQDEITKFIND